MVILPALMIASSLTSDSAFAQRGLALTARIQKEFALPDSHLYAEKHGESQPAFDWSVGVWLSALNSAVELDAGYKKALREFADATWVYWNDKGPVPGYDVLPAPKPVDRYYDDNAWMVMALVETYDHLGDAKYLDWAQKSLSYVLSGEDEKLGGGIYWRESDRGASKNTCSNAPSAAACLAVWEKTKDGKLLAKARELYAWTYKTLRDPDDGLMWDAISADGKIEKMKWSYNTALMIRTAAGLYAATKRETYRRQALEFEAAATKHWFDPATGALKDEGKFGHLLTEAFLFRRKWAPGGDDKAVEASRRALENLESASKSKEGWYPARWDQGAPSGAPALIDQAAVARGYLEMAAR
ncbi:glycoside hydrolase family 76 protein [soil metagenome]